MLFQQLRQYLVFVLQLALQRGNPLLRRLQLLVMAGIERGGPLFEKLLLPAVKHRGMNAQLITQIGDRYPFQKVTAQKGDFLLGGISVSFHRIFLQLKGSIYSLLKWEEIPIPSEA